MAATWQTVWYARRLARIATHSVRPVAARHSQVGCATQRQLNRSGLKEAAGALQDLAADPKHLGAELGLTALLQTWPRDLRYHPHCICWRPAADSRAINSAGCA